MRINQSGNLMRTKLRALSTLLTFAALSSIGTAWCADVVSDTEQVKQQPLAIPSAQQAVASATGYETKNIEIKSTAHQVTITVVNSKLNSGAAKDREAEAATMVSSFAQAIGDKAEFTQVTVIHVDYVKRPGKSKKAIQRLDFYKSPAGVFVAHKT
jgi:hypothetical protein